MKNSSELKYFGIQFKASFVQSSCGYLEVYYFRLNVTDQNFLFSTFISLQQSRDELLESLQAVLRSSDVVSRFKCGISVICKFHISWTLQRINFSQMNYGLRKGPFLWILLAACLQITWPWRKRDGARVFILGPGSLVPHDGCG